MAIKIKNWSSYQSYKDRKPPWIRFHKSMLDNYEYHIMTAEARALLPMLWLLASEDEDPVSGLIRDSYGRVTFRLRMSENDFLLSLQELEKAGFVEITNDLQVIENKPCNETVTDTLRIRNQTVTPETETETETETEVKRTKLASSLPSNWQMNEELKSYAMQKGLTDLQAKQEAEKFKDHWLATGKPFKDWDAVWRKWVTRSLEYRYPNGVPQPKPQRKVL